LLLLFRERIPSVALVPDQGPNFEHLLDP